MGLRSKNTTRAFSRLPGHIVRCRCPCRSGSTNAHQNQCFAFEIEAEPAPVLQWDRKDWDDWEGIGGRGTKEELAGVDWDVGWEMLE